MTDPVDPADPSAPPVPSVPSPPVVQQRTEVRNVFTGTATYVVQANQIHGGIHLHAAPDETPQDRAARELSRVVHAQWRDEAAVRGLVDGSGLAVHWDADPTSADHPAHVGPTAPGAGLAELAASFRTLPGGRLVLLGEPGAGKTSLALLLTLELLRTLGADRSRPVPVILLAATWEPAKEHLDAWLTRRIHQEYGDPRAGLGRQAVAGLVRDRRVLPVIDGLDELPPAARTAALDGLNRGLSDGAPLILTSRTAEYAESVAVGDVLHAATVVRARPVDPAAAAEHLRAASHPQRAARWAPLLAELTAAPDGPAALALSSPLMLWLARTVYAGPGAEPGELADRTAFPTRLDVERHLLDSLVPAVFRTAPASPHEPRPVRPWGPRRAEVALRFLAAHLTRLRTRELAWWQLRRARLPQALSAPALIVCYLLVSFLATDLGHLFTDDVFERFVIAAGTTSALMFGLTGGMLLQLAVLWRAELPRRPVPVFRRGRQPLPALFWVVLLLLPPAQLLTGSPPLVLLGFTAPLLLGVLLGLPTDTAQTVGPRALLGGERRSALLSAGVLGPSVGLIAGQFIAPAGAAPAVRAAILVTGALGAGAVLLVMSPWASWLLAKASLAATGRLPWHLTAFLEDARRVGVLRQVGGVYQFRHARLQAQLATGGGKAPGRRSSAGAAAGPEVGARAGTGAGAEVGVGAGAGAGARPTGPVRIDGHTGLLLKRWQPENYATWWIVLIWVLMLVTSEDPWDAEGWSMIGFFLALPVVLDLVMPGLVRRRAHLLLDDEGVTFTALRRTVTFAWADVEVVAVRRFEPPVGESEDVMVHLRLLPSAAPAPGLRVNRSGWVALWPLHDGVVPDELDRALARFAGARWHPPTGEAFPGDFS